MPTRHVKENELIFTLIEQVDLQTTSQIGNLHD